MSNKAKFAIALATLVIAGAPAQARGCLKGAAAGAVAGHLMHHHAIAGAAAGCAAGHVYAHHHMRKKHM